MKHFSFPVENTIQFIETSVEDNPLTSRCKIKVCYVCDQPNRNNVIMSKEILTEMGRNLPGSPIVGFYGHKENDFLGHEEDLIVTEDGDIMFKPSTVAYGYVPDDAKVWFETYTDDGIYEREYLVTEGRIWTDRFPEAKRIIEQGNGQSMELHRPSLDATRVTVNNEPTGFFIINEALISALCILGEEVEPCFEGASVTKFSLNGENTIRKQFESLVTTFSSKQGGQQKMNIRKYEVGIGSPLWTALYNKLDDVYPSNSGIGSQYSIEGMYLEGESTTFATLRSKDTNSLQRMNFSVAEDTGMTLGHSLIDVTDSFMSVESQFSAKEVADWESVRYAAKIAAATSPKETYAANEEEDKEEDTKKKGSKKEDEDEEEPKTDNSLAEANTEFAAKYEQLAGQHNELMTKFSAMQTEFASLVEFKQSADLKEKQAMIASFSMLSDEMKADVVNNIDQYTCQEIESKLAVVCLHNKVNFTADEKENQDKHEGLTYSLSGSNTGAGAPSWLNDVRKTQQAMGQV